MSSGLVFKKKKMYAFLQKKRKKDENNNIAGNTNIKNTIVRNAQPKPSLSYGSLLIFCSPIYKIYVYQSLQFFYTFYS